MQKMPDSQSCHLTAINGVFSMCELIILVLCLSALMRIAANRKIVYPQCMLTAQPQTADRFSS